MGSRLILEYFFSELLHIFETLPVVNLSESLESLPCTTMSQHWLLTINKALWWSGCKLLT